jgi:hypothetical protein
MWHLEQQPQKDASGETISTLYRHVPLGSRTINQFAYLQRLLHCPECFELSPVRRDPLPAQTASVYEMWTLEIGKSLVKQKNAAITSRQARVDTI